MVHVLASHLRSEFLAVPELVRLDMAQGGAGLEPTLLIKTSSLSLKYILRQRSLRLIIARFGQYFLYGVEFPDDLEHPGTAWSLIQRPAEVIALKTLTQNPTCTVFLFNELAVSVAWTTLNIEIKPNAIQELDSTKYCDTDGNERARAVSAALDAINNRKYGQYSDNFSFQEINWKEIRATYITNRHGTSSLSLFSRDEGGQQEELAVWLTDGLRPDGCIKSPQVLERPPRELSDLLMSYENGAFLIESKSLNVLLRNNVPRRSDLSSDLSKHIDKAARQLTGGLRNMRNGMPITDRDLNILQVERKKPAHAIILVPDLGLLSDRAEFGANFLRDFAAKSGCFLHILDPAELLRIVQVAEMVSKKSLSVTKIMAFDWYLLKRHEVALTYDTPSFGVLFRMSE